MEGGGVADDELGGWVGRELSEGAAVLDGRTLTPAAVADIARRDRPVRLDPAAVERNAAAFALGARLAGDTPLYGANTGVGALLHERVPPGQGRPHALALLRSHASGAGPLAPRDVVRALLVVRLNQLAAGGAGVSPAVLDAVAAALNAGFAPEVHELGGIGTGDLTALAEALLALVGEDVELAAGDGLALLSSNALTLGETALRACDAGRLIASAETVVALGHRAVRGRAEAYDPRVAAARGHPGEVDSAARLLRLLGDAANECGRLQDPLSYRCAPQVLGAARDAHADLLAVLTRELNAGAPNPLLVPNDGVALHHGGFDATRLALAVAGLRLALAHVGAQSVARTSALLDPRRTGLRAFLAGGAPGSSGALALEYTANAALAALRAAAVPEPPGAVLALGQEDWAPFTATGARQLRAALDALGTVLGCECVAAVRALRLTGAAPPPAVAALPADLGDRPLAEDITAATDLVRNGL